MFSMESQLTPLGKFIKWVLIPLILAWIGYQFVGPNLGKFKLNTTASNPPAQSESNPTP